MSTPLAEIAPVPKAPRAPDAPDVEGVLGPPPHAPHIGGRGKGLHLAGRLRSPAPPPRLARKRPPAPAPAQAPARPQKIVIEQKGPPAEAKPKTLQEEYAPVEPEINKHAGKPIQRAVRNAALVRDQINASGLRRERTADDETTPSAEPRPANVEAHHQETSRQVREQMELLRRPPPQSEAQP